MEKVYDFHQSDNKLIEKILDDDAVMINHMILNDGDAIPQHDSNSNVYLLIVRGTLSVRLAENEERLYGHGNIVNIPGGVTMNISNAITEQTEFFVIKAPSPRLYK